MSSNPSTGFLDKVAGSWRGRWVFLLRFLESCSEYQLRLVERLSVFVTIWVTRLSLSGGGRNVRELGSIGKTTVLGAAVFAWLSAGRIEYERLTVWS